MRRLLFIAVLLAWGPHAGAAAPNCPTSLPQEQLNQCYVAAFEATEARLDALLHDLSRTLDRKRWGKVKYSQDLWENVRDVDCKLEASFLEGPAREAVRYGCSEKMGRQRIQQLRYYLCPRYNLTGQCDAERLYQ